MTFAGLGLLVSCSPAPGESADPSGQTASTLDALSTDELAQRAAVEGTVTVYSFTSRIGQVERAFEAAYPGVDLVGHDLSSTEQIERLEAEEQAGAAGADVAYLADAPVVLSELTDRGLLRRYVPPTVAGEVAPEHAAPLLAHRLSTKVLMYNEDAHRAGAPVTNLWELTEPAWRGRVVLVDPLIRGDYLDLLIEVSLQSAAMAHAYREHTGTPLALDPGVRDAGEQWVRRLLANDPVLVDDTDEVNQRVGQVGQAAPPVGFTSYSDRRDNAEQGWALQVAHEVAPAPGIVFPALLGLTREPPHPAAARLLISFLMGDGTPSGGPGWAPFAVPGEYPTRQSIAHHPGALPLDQLGAWPVDAAATAAARDRVVRLILEVR